jgi:hypothetical protein
MTAGRAILAGPLAVNAPVFLLMLGPLWLFVQFVEREAISRADSWMGVVVLAVGVAAAWLWWSLSVPRWRVWSYERVPDIAVLKKRAIEVGLTWPDSHFFARTEINSTALARRERDLETSQWRRTRHTEE